VKKTLLAVVFTYLIDGKVV